MPLTVKIKYNDDVRRVTVEQELKFAALRELVRNMFGLNEFTVKYQDCDGDWCTISSDLELGEAIDHCATISTAPTVSMSITGRPLFRVSVFDIGAPTPSTPTPAAADPRDTPTPVATPAPSGASAAPGTDPIAAMLSSVLSSPAAQPVVGELLKGAVTGQLDTEALIGKAADVIESQDLQKLIASAVAGATSAAAQGQGKGGLETLIGSLVKGMGSAGATSHPSGSGASPTPPKKEPAVEAGNLYADFFSDMDPGTPPSAPSFEKPDDPPVTFPSPTAPSPAAGGWASNTLRDPSAPAAGDSPCPAVTEKPPTSSGWASRTLPVADASPAASPTRPAPVDSPVRSPVSPCDPVVSEPVAPKPTVGKYLARYVRDVTCADNSTVRPDEKFSKTWCLRNDGDAPWPEGTTLTWVGGQRMADSDVTPVPSCPPKQMIEIATSLTAPNAPGRYVSYFVLSTPDGQRFGHRMWVDIVVVAAAREPVAPPTPEPAPVEPQPEPQPHPPASPPIEIPEKYQTSMQLLENMGFTNKALNLAILEHNKGHFQNALSQLCEITQ